MLRRSTAPIAVLSVLAGAALPLGAAAVGAPGCSDGDVGEVVENADGGHEDRPTPATVTLLPDAAPLPGESSCKVIETVGIAVTRAQHFPICTAIDYPTNPPSGGDHWPCWAAYAKYQTPVPREMYVHNLEHGGVVLSYRCKDPCPEVVAALESAFDGAVDAFCATQTPKARALLTPDPDLTAPIAVSAWGATYVATCLDPPSLNNFINKVIGHGTEMLCAEGNDPEKLVLLCEGGGTAASCP
jgi:hypothetical protein